MLFKVAFFALLAAIHMACGSGGYRKYVVIRTMNAVPLSKSHGVCPRVAYKYENKNPYAAKVKRGGLLRMNGFKNDFLGGFVRFSMVPASEMYNKKAHDSAAFLYSCADTRLGKCTYATKSMCRFDRKGELYRYFVKIPKIFPDGIYTLSVARYGSIASYPYASRRGFGDYLGCVRILINGGDHRAPYRPRYLPGPTIGGYKNYCLARFNYVYCNHRSCAKKAPSLTKPVEFIKGKITPLIQKRPKQVKPYVQKQKRPNKANPVAHQRPKMTTSGDKY